MSMVSTTLPSLARCTASRLRAGKAMRPLASRVALLMPRNIFNFTFVAGSREPLSRSDSHLSPHLPNMRHYIAHMSESSAMRCAKNGINDGNQRTFRSRGTLQMTRIWISISAAQKSECQPVSRVLSRTIIHLGLPSPTTSSGLPGSDTGRIKRSLFGLAPGGVYLATTCYHARGALLPHPFTLTECVARTSAVYSLLHFP